MEPTGEASNLEHSDFSSGPAVSGAAQGNEWSINFLPPEIGDFVTPEILAGRKVLPAVAAMTREIYSGKIDCFEEGDPELANVGYIVFRVEESGPMDEIMKRHNAWHHRLARMPISIPLVFCLSIHSRE